MKNPDLISELSKNQRDIQNLIDVHKKAVFSLRKQITEAGDEEIENLKHLLTYMFEKFIRYIDKSLTTSQFEDSVDVFVPDGVFKVDILAMHSYLDVNCQRKHFYDEYMDERELDIYQIQLISYIPVDGVDGVYEIEFTIGGDASYQHLTVHSQTLEDLSTVKQYIDSIFNQNKYI